MFAWGPHWEREAARLKRNGLLAWLLERWRAWGDSVVVLKELIDAADELRLLGNDAAHISAKKNDAIGPEPATLAIELSKEPLKAVREADNRRRP